MNRILLILALLTASLSAYAHQPDLSSTILAEQSEGKWVLQIRASLTAFEYEVEARFGESAYATPEAFQELVLDHIRKEVFVRFNKGSVPALRDGAVQLGHETTVTFQLDDLPTDVTSVLIRNAAFSNILHNHSALYVVKEGFAKKQFLLSESNAHTANLRVGDREFALASAGSGFTGVLPLLLLGGLGIIATLIYLTYPDKQRTIPAGYTPNHFS